MKFNEFFLFGFGCFFYPKAIFISALSYLCISLLHKYFYLHFFTTLLNNTILNIKTCIYINSKIRFCLNWSILNDNNCHYNLLNIRWNCIYNSFLNRSASLLNKACLPTANTRVLRHFCVVINLPKFSHLHS